MSYFITIQYPYQYLTITLSDATTILSTETVSKFQAMSQLIPTLKNMLAAQNIELTDIACIGVNTGPGPFNTLRSIIATANGITFATNIPLVGCNGLDLLIQETDHANVVAILDAFGSDVYFAIKSSDYAKASTNTSGKQGYNSIEKVIEKLNLSERKSPYLFIGNGASKHKEFIMQNFSGIAEFDETCLFASTQSLVNETVQKYSQAKIEREIFPLYFESPVVKN